MKHSIDSLISHIPPLLRNVYFLSVIVLVGLGFFFLNNATKKAPVETTRPTEGLIVQTIKVTGPVTPTSEAMLSFEKGGTISSVNVEVGDKVSAGQVLASLSSQDLYASLLQAKATLANQEAVLEQLETGARPEELAIKMQALENAKANLTVAYSGVADVIRDADAKISDAIKTKLGSFFTVNSGTYLLTTESCDQNFKGSIETKRTALEKTLATFQKSAATISALSDTSTLDAAINEAHVTTLAATSLLDDLSTFLSSSCATSNTSLDTQRATVSSVRTSIGVLFAEINTKRSAFTTAKNTVTVAERDLDLTKAGTDKAKVRAQVALVAQAQAQVVQAQASLSKSTLAAPFNGIITKVDITKGETASAGKSAITLISSSAFQIEAKIPEIDIAKIAVNNTVKVTLDAYGDALVFEAVVSRIDPSATLEGNVPVYKAIISFKEIDSRIKAGMTANLDIVTASKEKALFLPIRFVTVEKDGTGIVQVVSDEVRKATRVILGIRGDNGTIEIISGILPTDVVEAVQPGVRSAQKQTD